MRVSWILFLVVGGVLITNTEASWFKKTIGKVTNWVKNHCTISIPGGVSCGGFGRKRRSVDYAFAPWQTTGLQNAQLPNFGPWPATGDGNQQLPGMGPWPNAGDQGQPLPAMGQSSNPGGPSQSLPMGPFPNLGDQGQQMPNFPNWLKNAGSGLRNIQLQNFRAAPQMANLDPETGFDCNSASFPVDELPRELFDEAFRETDENEDEQMDDKEANTLLTTLKIVKNCVEKQNEMKRKK